MILLRYKGHSQREIADALGVSHQMVSNVERGATSAYAKVNQHLSMRGYVAEAEKNRSTRRRRHRDRPIGKSLVQIAPTVASLVDKISVKQPAVKQPAVKQPVVKQTGGVLPYDWPLGGETRVQMEVTIEEAQAIEENRRVAGNRRAAGQLRLLDTG